MIQIPHWLKSYLKSEDIEEVSSAIKQAERLTSGEILPMIVRSSSTQGHVVMTLFCLFTIIFFLSGAQGIQQNLGAENPLWLLLDFIFFWGLAVMLAKLPFFKRIFIPKSDQEFQVFNRAKLAFYEEGLNQTHGATGILIFLSLLERRVVVLADKAIHEKLPQGTWEGIVKLILNGVKNNDLKGGLISAIAECGQILSQSFPRSNDDQNELRDRLIIAE